MALSIPKEESRAIYVAGANDYVNKRLNNSTEENANKAFEMINGAIIIIIVL